MVLNILKFRDLSLIVRKEKREFEARLANAGISEAVLTTKCMSICIGEVLGEAFLLASLSGCRRDRNDIWQRVNCVLGLFNYKCLVTLAWRKADHKALKELRVLEDEFRRSLFFMLFQGSWALGILKSVGCQGIE